MRKLECARCHGVADGPSITHIGKKQTIPLCINCYRFISMLFDDVIDGYSAGLNDAKFVDDTTCKEENHENNV